MQRGLQMRVYQPRRLWIRYVVKDLVHDCVTFPAAWGSALLDAPSRLVEEQLCEEDTVDDVHEEPRTVTPPILIACLDGGEG